MNPSVSVVIPTHDRAHLLKRAVVSALEQTVVPDEIIVVDDGSTDETAEVVRRIGSNRVRYLHQVRQERSAARNRGIHAARSHWIAFLDSDDLWETTHVEHLTNAVCPGVATVYSGYVHSDERAEHVFESVLEGPSGDLFERIAFERVRMITSGTMVERKALLSIGGFSTDLRIGEDWVLFLRLASRWPVAFSRHATAVLREHVGRSMRDSALVSQDAPRAADIALQDSEVVRRLGNLTRKFRARRDLSVAVKLRANHLNAEARALLFRALSIDRFLFMNWRFSKTVLRTYLSPAFNQRITGIATVARNRACGQRGVPDATCTPSA